MDSFLTNAIGKNLYLWPADSADLNESASQLAYFGYVSRRFASPEELSQAAQEQPPACILVDCDAAGPECARVDNPLTRLSRQYPMACVAGGGVIEARLAAVRMGCEAYLTRPLDITNLLDTLDRLTSPTQAEAGKVLIVDDSPSLAAYYAAHLNAAGFITQVVTDPMKTLFALDEQPPELILLDMNMPVASGQEIAQVIRQQDAFLSIPIVFLSAENDVARQREAMSLGGDEFLSKPIEPEHLISAVKSRVARYRVLRALMMRDSLTGLLNHTSFKERLRAEVSRAKRQNRPLSVALIDIDFFKKVNDTYGHPAGDRVIKNLARLLKQRLRGADVIGRYGGEEFAAALPDTTGEMALRVLDGIRESFAAIAQQAGENHFHTTLSCGIARGGGSDAETLIQHADEALYVAKHEGRNQVRLSPLPG